MTTSFLFTEEKNDLATSWYLNSFLGFLYVYFLSIDIMQRCSEIYRRLLSIQNHLSYTLEEKIKSFTKF